MTDTSVADVPLTTSAPPQTQATLGLWLSGALLALANFVAVLDMSIANVSVPNIAGALGVTSSQGTWVITSYAVAEAITVPLTGWLASRFGTVRVFVLSLIGFGLASLLCGLSPTFQVLLAARVVQGFCGGPLMPLSQTLLLTIFPKKLQPAAMGIWGVTTLVAPVAGPVLGGALCDNLGWGSIFLINVPIAICAGVLVWRAISKYETPISKSPIDGIGLLLLIVWVGALQVMLDIGKDHEWFESPLIVGLAVTAFIGFVAFVIWELTDASPIVNLRVFRHSGFSIAMICLALMVGSFFAINVLGPLWMQSNLGWTATWAGNATGLVGILAVVSAPLASQMTTKFDPRKLVFAGVLWMAITTFVRGLSTTDMSFSQVGFWILLAGAGMPFFFMPLIQVSMGAVEPAEMASASGLQNFIRTMAGAIATSLVTTVWENTATARHAELASAMTSQENGLNTLVQAGMDHQSVVGTLNDMVSSQALMLATNTIFLGVSAIFALCACIVWILPRPRTDIDMSHVH